MDNPVLFVSSTCYDLTDVRQIIRGFATEELRLRVRLSDDAADSAFDIHDGLPAVETCLLNLERSDWVIFILDRRYGPALGRLGGQDYGDRSATHVEMERALALNKRTLLLVRSQLLGLYDAHANAWFKKQLTATDFPALKPRWLASANDLRLFELIRMYSATNRWRESFASVLDIKRLLWNQFRKYRYREDVRERIQRNDVPHLLVRLVTWDRRPDGRTRLAAQIANATSYLAYNVRIRLGDGTPDPQGEMPRPPLSFVAAGQAVDAHLVLPGGAPHPGDRHLLTLTYEFGIGQSVEDSYAITFDEREMSFMLECSNKIYYVGDTAQATGPRIVFREVQDKVDDGQAE